MCVCLIKASLVQRRQGQTIHIHASAHTPPTPNPKGVNSFSLFLKLARFYSLLLTFTLQLLLTFWVSFCSDLSSEDAIFCSCRASVLYFYWHIFFLKRRDFLCVYALSDLVSGGGCFCLCVWCVWLQRREFLRLSCSCRTGERRGRRVSFKRTTDTVYTHTKKESE